ncbi:MAG: transcription-repair coupling factor [Chloroflexi bacterium]|nr:transcription-repair coupling factor [Chloroflexota bacterium]
MNLSGLLPLIEQLDAFKHLTTRLRDQATITADVIESARAPMLAALSRALFAPIVVLTARSERAKQIASELNAWVSPVIASREAAKQSPSNSEIASSQSAAPLAGKTLLAMTGVFDFPEPDPLFYERIPWSAETIAARLSALAALAGNPAPIIVTTIRAVMQRTVPPADFVAGMRALRRGENVNLTELLSALVALGYEYQAVVESPGAFSRRGGILDVWIPASPQPVRIEFVGDEINSIRAFDPATQRSAQELKAVMLTPASEALPGRGRDVAQKIATWDLSTCHPIAESGFKRDRDALDEGRRFHGIEFYLQYFYPNPASLVDHLPEQGLLVVEDWAEVEANAQSLEFQAEDVRGDLEARRELPANVALPYFPWNALRERMLSRKRLLLDYATPGEAIQLPFTPGPRYGGQLRKVMDELFRLREENARVVVVTRQAARLSELLRERDFFVKPTDHIAKIPEPKHIVLVQGALAEGFKLQVQSSKLNEPPTLNLEPRTLNFELLTDAELFGWSRPKPRRVAKTRAASPEAFFSDLAIGDYIVHVDHGIGIFRGLTRFALNGPEREFLQIEYLRGDTLYVPVHQIDRLSRYVAPGGRAPTLSRLGTAEWTQVKERTRKAVEDIADDLLELYAAREVVSGHAFAPDNQWQNELEASFAYVETDDQLRAIDEVKVDMERARPMDRLIVGDVGYGKTEVALRAAFKAANDGKQIAILVPTTVLAQQHFNTFSERLAPFPLTVEMLSRFRSDREQREIVEKIQAGTVDIVIGTHRLLSDDVQFKDLGLLIIDEEQRFGVVHKEKLKQLRQQVDVLTLTATPIPRTLYLSLSGARDMSTIETPPEDRLPIRTYVAEYDERLVRDAILRELDRGGQVFYVHNRVRGIHIVADQLRKLVPEANIVIGHGQMNEAQLEAVMADFATGKYDVLVCTTIIESGIDIPNANTLVVAHADKFGLAQLYQLRGRVGRSAARAYAYFLHEKNHPLSAEAHDRLQAIAEASELGAGFQIAMRDLEIRGAGEILGAQQSGHIVAVGFDLYCRLLASAVEMKKGQVTRDKGSERAKGGLGFAPIIDLPLPAQIPEEYVPDSGLRLRLYRRLADITTAAQVDEIAQELVDRFGKPPEQIENLLYLLRIKVAAIAAHIVSITTEEGRIVIRLGRADAALTARLQSRFKDRVRVSRDRAWLAFDGDPRWREHLRAVVNAMTERKD